MNMPYTVSYDENKDIVKILFTAIDTKDEHFYALHDAYQICSKNSCKKLLIDLSNAQEKKMTKSIVESFNFAELAAEKLKGFKVAHVIPDNPTYLAEIKFVLTVEHNRGIQSKEFYSVENALKWLC